MILGDKIINLRKKNGWSQEEFAEKMNVSRQSVSKWEGAQSVPELEKILIMSDIFGVTVDYLLKDDTEDTMNTTDEVVEEKPQMMAGIVICIAGIVSMVIWGLLSIFRPETSNQLSDSSMITIDGNGIFLILCVVAIVVGASLLLKGKKK